jgi:hypothetical protein
MAREAGAPGTTGGGNAMGKWETPGTFVLNLIYVGCFVTLYVLTFWELARTWRVQ